MAPITAASDETTHQALLNQLDLYSVPRPFRNPSWRPPQRRNKTVKQILSEASRKEASMMPSQFNSGASTPLLAQSEASTTAAGAGALTPATGNGVAAPSAAAAAPVLGAESRTIVQAAQRLDRLVLERNQDRLLARRDGGDGTAGGMANGAGAGGGGGPQVTYTNIESAPSLHPSSQRHYCDITGLPAPYTDPKTRLRYHNIEVFQLIRTMGTMTTEGYLAARGAHTVLK